MHLGVPCHTDTQHWLPAPCRTACGCMPLGSWLLVRVSGQAAGHRGTRWSGWRRGSQPGWLPGWLLAYLRDRIGPGYPGSLEGSLWLPLAARRGGRWEAASGSQGWPRKAASGSRLRPDLAVSWPDLAVLLANQTRKQACFDQIWPLLTVSCQ